MSHGRMPLSVAISVAVATDWPGIWSFGDRVASNRHRMVGPCAMVPGGLLRGRPTGQPAHYG